MALRRRDSFTQPARLPSGDWHPEYIKAAVRMSAARMSLLKLATDREIHPHACHHAIARPHYEGELAIAEHLGQTPAEIWPSRFDALGIRLCQVRTRAKPSAELTSRHRENGGRF
jgi:Ner family transcriptional regulator